MLAKQMKEMANKDLKILVCCLNLKYSALYKLFRVDVSSTGLEDLVNYQCFEEDRPEVLSSIVPKSEGIYFLGSYRTTNSYVQKNIDKYSRLMEELQRSFDLIIIDTVSGKENVLTNLVLEKANIVLKLYVQDTESTEELSNAEEAQKPYNQEYIYMVSKYRNIYPKLSDIRRRYKLKNRYTMEYCETLQEMKNRDSLHLYLQRETSCNNSVECVSKYILEALNLMPQEEKVKEKTRKYMRSLIEAIQRN
jgi:MinD-like ATPase involved in chromosome partitioning or flagellar assembly